MCPQWLLAWASLVAQLVKNLPAVWEAWVRSLCWKVPWRREQLPTVCLSGKSHGQMGLVGLSDFHFTSSKLHVK